MKTVQYQNNLSPLLRFLRVVLPLFFRRSKAAKQKAGAQENFIYSMY
jgi:hypothetical protein